MERQATAIEDFSPSLSNLSIIDYAHSGMDKDRLSQVFGGVWSELMRTPVHLDSLLARQSPRAKSILAQVLPPILMRPASLADMLGVGLPGGQPWNLDSAALGSWPAARHLALGIHSALQTGALRFPRAIPDDYPPQMREAILANWGSDLAEKMMEALAVPPPLSLRITRRVDRTEFLNRWKSSGKIPVRLRESLISPWGIVLEGYTPVLNSPEFERGEFEIQDEGSQLMAAFALSPETFAELLTRFPGETPLNGVDPDEFKKFLTDRKWASFRVVDACAGAGGKSLALADLMNGQGRVFSYDISLPKLQALRRRATRAGLRNIQAVQLTEGEEAQALSQFEKSADRVLVDAPCSGWGVLRRNPDIKWRQSIDSLARFPQIQLRLLKAYSNLVAPEGILVFGTCTFRKEETSDVADQFLEAHGSEFKKGPGGFLGPGSSDGFFMQSFIRRS